MLPSSEAIKQDLDQLNDEQLQQVADFIAFLKFRAHRSNRILDPAQLALLSTEFANADRTLAEAGIDDYAALLDREDES